MHEDASHDAPATDDTGGGWYSNENATFGDRLAAARDALGLTQGELARRVGVKLKTLQGWENDASEPRANRLSMLAGILNVSLVWLLNGEGAGLPEPDDYSMPQEISGLLTEIRQLKGTMVQTAERLGGIEKRLQKALKEQPR